MPTDLIRYDLLVQEALKSVVRKVLADAARDGLPGEHHFYVTFRTDAPGVRLSQRVRDEYPREMTIILQHQFWDLGVTEHNFEVGLSFRGVPERLLVPFDALTGFSDPSVQFGLKFQVEERDAETGANDALPPPKPPPAEAAPPPAKPQPLRVPAAKAPVAEPAADVAAAAEPEAGEPKTKVISIDAFRKKT